MSHLLFGIVIPNIFETIPKERGNGKNKLKLLSLRGLGVSPVIKLFLTKRTVFVGPKTLLLALFGFSSPMSGISCHFRGTEGGPTSDGRKS